MIWTFSSCANINPRCKSPWMLFVLFHHVKWFHFFCCKTFFVDFFLTFLVCEVIIISFLRKNLRNNRFRGCKFFKRTQISFRRFRDLTEISGSRGLEALNLLVIFSLSKLLNVLGLWQHNHSKIFLFVILKLYYLRLWFCVFFFRIGRYHNQTISIPQFIVF